jgi:ribosomal protein S8
MKAKRKLSDNGSGRSDLSADNPFLTGDPKLNPNPMPLPYDLCARLQNAFRARHARISVPHTTQNLGILSILLRAGFLTNITRGTIEAPSPEMFLEAGEAQRRIWADLKYRNDRPVLENMHLVSKPSKRVFMDISEIRKLVSGRSVNTIKPLGMGEIAVVRTKNKEYEWLEAREALQLHQRGEVVCRAS